MASTHRFPKPNPRTISFELVSTEQVTPHSMYSAMLMQWGQFVDHDLDFIATALSRQTYTGGARQVTFREQVNIITSYLDGSQIYGSTEVDALDLRDLFSDHGQLRFDIVSSAQKPYLPFERDSSMDCRRNFSVENPIRCFLSGDFRANEQFIKFLISVNLNILPTYALPEGIENSVALREEMIQNKKMLVTLQKEMKHVIAKMAEVNKSNKAKMDLIFKSNMVLIVNLNILPTYALPEGIENSVALREEMIQNKKMLVTL
uniref:Peroxidasin n=1 Tax=Globodera pallida TaxID=36090 RepID=A0A183CQE8_GLOPA